MSVLHTTTDLLLLESADRNRRLYTQKRGDGMIDKQKLLGWLDSQIENKQLTKDMAIILGVLYGLIETGVFDCNQQWREEVHTNEID